MGAIRVLDDHIANQIAAGEVVERPASVVKELVENAIDAGSTKIEVAVEEGGLALIRVADNGAGIAPDDIRTAFLRHATSKIRTGKDLFQIRSLGFRGEALPSIAAVSKVRCVSSANAAGDGRFVVIEGGSFKEEGVTASPQGTEFAIRELFYNTPARLKYMKTVQTELGHISDYVYRMALAHPHTAFSLTHNGTSLLQTAGKNDLLQAIAAIYGMSSAKAMVRIQAESPDYKVTGFISKPELTRANRYGISLIINGRYIRHYGLAQALLQGYHTMLPVGRFPLVALHISMDPSLVDVNVHPSKLEVRFSKEPELLQLVQEAAKAALTGERLIPGVPVRKEKPAVVQERLEFYGQPAQQAVPRVPFESANGSGALQARGGAANSGESYKASYDAPERTLSAPISETKVREMLKPPEGGPEAAAVPAELISEPARQAGEPPTPINGIGRSGESEEEARHSDRTGDQASDKAPDAPGVPTFPELTPIGQVHGTYIVAQSEDGMYLIDQHAAHERIHYEYYAEKFGMREIVSQELLLPITLEFTPSDASALRGLLPLLEQVGLVLEPFGGNAYLVRSHPEWMPKGEEQEIIKDMIEWVLSQRKAPDIGKLREKAAILCSCKASIKANQHQTMALTEKLLMRLRACKQPYTCPHGRPILVHFSTYELEKMFKRVM